MGLAMEVIGGFATNAGATITACTPATGDAFAVRNFVNPQGAHLLNLWARGVTAGVARIRSPRLHDNVQGIRVQYAAADPVPLLDKLQRQLLYAQDTLTVEISGGGAETDSLSYLSYYEDLPGSSARLIRPAEFRARLRNVMTTEVTMTTGATLGSWGGSVAINSTFDQFKANTDYAILGYVLATAVTTLGIRGPDFGNLRLGGPGTTSRIETRDWFVSLSEQYDIAAIPVFNAANKAGTLVDCLSNLAGTSIVADLICAELAT